MEDVRNPEAQLAGCRGPRVATWGFQLPRGLWQASASLGMLPWFLSAMPGSSRFSFTSIAAAVAGKHLEAGPGSPAS